MRNALAISATLAAALAAASMAGADTINATSGFGPDHPVLATGTGVYNVLRRDD